MVYHYILAAVVATLSAVHASRYARAAMPDRWRFRLRLAARRLYLLPVLAATGCTGTVVAGAAGAGGATTDTDTTSTSNVCTATGCPPGSCPWSGQCCAGCLNGKVCHIGDEPYNCGVNGGPCATCTIGQGCSKGVCS